MIGFAAAFVFETIAHCDGGDCDDPDAGGGFNETDTFRGVWAVPLLIAPIVLTGMTLMPASPRWVRTATHLAPHPTVHRTATHLAPHPTVHRTHARTLARSRRRVD